MIAERKRILIVDDDLDFVESLSCFLEANDFRVLRAANAQQGIRVARLEHPDLIVMDIMMDERTEGLFAVQEMRRAPELKDVPIFVVSALYSQTPEFGIAPDAAWMAHDEFLPKPVDLRELLARIRSRIGVPS